MKHRHTAGRALVRLAALLALALPAGAGAQVRAARLNLDNDAFNFWIPFAERPDQEYTNGSWLSLELAGAPGWVQRAPAGFFRCPEGGADCLSRTVEFGQKLYAPRSDGVVLIPGDRPYAGWLFAAGTVQRATARSRRSLGVELGVTGPPSLGEPVHKAWHELTGYYDPLGWDNQVGFEPALALRYEGAQLLDVSAGGVRVADAAPYWGAAAGNLLTGAHAGVRLRAGYALPHPWRSADEPSPGDWSLYLLAGVRHEAVARNLFLNGNTFGPDLSVEPLPLVRETEVGGGVRYRGATLEYRVNDRTREYRTQPEGHTFSSFVLTLEMPEKDAPEPAPAAPPSD